jgi:hypothetical protein
LKGGSGSGSQAPSGGPASAVPSLPNAPTTSAGSGTGVKIEVPQLPKISPTAPQPSKLALPPVQLPDTEQVTGDVTGEVTNTLQNTLP